MINYVGPANMEYKRIPNGADIKEVFLIQIEEYILNCYNCNGCIAVYINKSKNKTEADSSMTTAFHGSWFYRAHGEDVISGSKQKMIDNGLENFIQYVKDESKIHKYFEDEIVNAPIDLHEEQLQELCETLDKNKNKTYCIECGILIYDLKNKCWACEHGI